MVPNLFGYHIQRQVLSSKSIDPYIGSLSQGKTIARQNVVFFSDFSKTGAAKSISNKLLSALTDLFSTNVNYSFA